MDKTFRWYIENFGGLFIGVIIGLSVFLFIKPDGILKDPTTFVSKISDLGFIVFGFLLAFIGLIINIKDKLVHAHGSETIYKRTISFNVRVIKLSVIVGIFGFVLWTIYQTEICVIPLINNSMLSAFVLILCWLVWDLIYFIRIFFKLIKQYS